MANGTASKALTMRKDMWWVEPLVTGVVLGAFGIYSTWRALSNQFYYTEPYLSPFYSPLLLLDWWHFSPAILILWAPLGFRATCYYYRKAYYRAYFFSPPGCAVKPVGKRGSYKGESSFPFILQNIHRFFLYASIVILLFLWIDSYEAFFFHDGFGVGVGTIVLTLNAFLLTMYSFSCHSFRHLMGGNLDVFSRCPTRFRLWGAISVQNEVHMKWAWTSLVFVALTDLYVFLVANGTITDLRLI
ncbi:MAG: succinate dehydrogenase [Candidatus Dadabacteria bacterium]|nr:succinate dehydrogenase [Candidatus Dadabacteria bacterium]